jgi:hypothetical protein
LHTTFVVLPDSNTPLPDRLKDLKYSYFKDCLGALDGTHISAYIPIVDQDRFRNRKGTLSQNVLAVCNFDLIFVYLLPGWEGSAHDGRVLQDAQFRHGFNTPRGKFWLGDAGYGNSEFVLSPYRKVRYHLKEQRLAESKPQNARELFNLRHASLRNVIERIFGVLKRKFKILSQVAEYSWDTQVKLVLSLTGLFNFIRSFETIDDDEEEEGEEGGEEEEEGEEELLSMSLRTGNQYMNQKRDQIAQEMWVDYQKYLAYKV